MCLTTSTAFIEYIYIQYTCIYIKWVSSRTINKMFDVYNMCLTTPRAFIAYIYSIHVYISNGLVPELSTAFLKYRISVLTTPTAFIAYIYSIHVYIYISNGLVPELSTIFLEYRICV